MLLETVCDEIAAAEVDWLINGSLNAPGKLSTLWDLKGRYTLEKTHMEAEFKNILTGIEKD